MRTKKASSPVSLTAGFAGAGGLFLSCCLLFPLSAGNSSLPQLKSLGQFKSRLFVSPEGVIPAASGVNGAASGVTFPDPHGGSFSGSLTRRSGPRRGLGCKFCPVPSPYHNGTSTCGYSDVCVAWGNEDDEAGMLGGRGPRGHLPPIHILECRTPLGRLKTATCGVPRDVGKGEKEEGFSTDGHFKPSSPEPFDFGLGRLGYASAAEGQSESVTAETESDVPLTLPRDGPSTTGPHDSLGDGLLGAEHAASEAHMEGSLGAPQSGVPLAPQEGEADAAAADPGLGGQGEEAPCGHMSPGGDPAGEAASRLQTEHAPVQARHGGEHAEGAAEQGLSAGTGAEAGEAVPSEAAPHSDATLEEKRPAARAARAVPVGLEEFKRNMAMAAAAAAAAATVSQSIGGTGEEGVARGAAGGDAGGAFVSRVYADGSRYNYASATHGAKVAATNPETKRANAVLDEDKDKYLRVPCSTPGKFLVIELSEFLTRVDTIVVSNYEFYASSVKEFEVWGSSTYPTDRWVLLGTFCAKDVRKAQAFDFPENEGHVRYVMLRWLSHHGSEFYCTLSLVRVFGLDELESLREEMLAIHHHHHHPRGREQHKGAGGPTPGADRGATPVPVPFEGRGPAGAPGVGARMALGGGKGPPVSEEEDDDFLGRTVASLDAHGADAEEAEAAPNKAAPAQADSHAAAASGSPSTSRPSAVGAPPERRSGGSTPGRPSQGSSTNAVAGEAWAQGKEAAQARAAEVLKEAHGEKGEAEGQEPQSAGRVSAGAGSGADESGGVAPARAPGVDKEAREQGEHARAVGGSSAAEERPVPGLATAQEEKGQPVAPQGDLAAHPATPQAPTQAGREGQAGVRGSSAREAHRDSPQSPGAQLLPPTTARPGLGRAELAAACKGAGAHAQEGCASSSAATESRMVTPGRSPSSLEGGEGGQDGGRLSQGAGDGHPASAKGHASDSRPDEAVRESKHALEDSAPPVTATASHGGAEASECVQDPQSEAASAPQGDASRLTRVDNGTGPANVSAGGGNAAVAGTGRSSGQEPALNSSAGHRPLASTPRWKDAATASLPEPPNATAAGGSAPNNPAGAPVQEAPLSQAPPALSEHRDAAGTASTMGSGGAPSGDKEASPGTEQTQGGAHSADPGEGRRSGQEQASGKPSVGGRAHGQGQGPAAAQAPQNASADAPAQLGSGSARAEAAPTAQASAGTPDAAPEAASAGIPVSSAPVPGASGTGGVGTETRANAPPKAHPAEAATPMVSTDAGAGLAAALAPEEVLVARDGAGVPRASDSSTPGARATSPGPESAPPARVTSPATEARAAGADAGARGGMEGEEGAAGRVVAHEDAVLDDVDGSSALARTLGAFQGGVPPGPSSPAPVLPTVAGLGGGGSITGGGTAAVSGLKALMLKLRALEQNQSVLEQYVENLGRAYAEGLTDLDSEIASLHSHVGRLSQATDSLTATLQHAEDTRQHEIQALQHHMRSRSDHLEVHIQLLRGQVAAVERQMHFFLFLALATALSAGLLLLASCMGRRPTWDFVP